MNTENNQKNRGVIFLLSLGVEISLSVIKLVKAGNNSDKSGYFGRREDFPGFMKDSVSRKSASTRQEYSILINALIQKEAAARLKVTFEPSKKLLSRTPGVFTPYIYDTNGMPLQVRDAEGVNLNVNGADLLAREIVAHILKIQKKAAP